MPQAQDRQAAKLTFSEVLRLVLLGVALGAAPILLGVLLGFGAFVVTPVLIPFLGIGGGMFVAKIARRAIWTGICLSAAATAVTAAVPFVILAIANRTWALAPTLQGALYCGAAGLIAAVLLAAGAWIGGAWRPQS